MILFIAEHTNGKLKKSALELANAASTLAEKLTTDVVAAVIGSDVSSVASELATYTSKVIAVEDAALNDVRAEPYTSVVSSLAQELNATVIMVSASKSGLSYSARVAMRLDAALLEDVTTLNVDAGSITATRFSYLARVTETIKATADTVVISIKPNIFPVAQTGASGTVENKAANLAETDKRVTVGEKAAAKTGRVALDEANIIVTGGRGVGSPEGFAAIVEPLADSLNAGVGATRAVVDAGWRPYSEQVGQTGKTVAPNIYLALGVSGAVQHLSGMNRSKLIVAINKDPDAPIFKVADYGIVGDVNDVVPAFKEVVESL